MTDPDKIWIDRQRKIYGKPETEGIWDYITSNWSGDIISSPFIDTEYNKMMRAQTRLEGFEQVLGRKFTCKDCNYHKKRCCTIFSLEYRDLHPMKGLEARGCEGFSLSDKTREIINHIMRESDDLGIDTHPRFSINIKIDKKISGFYFKYIRLELIF